MQCSGRLAGSNISLQSPTHDAQHMPAAALGLTNGARLLSGVYVPHCAAARSTAVLKRRIAHVSRPMQINGWALACRSAVQPTRHFQLLVQDFG